ncbi:MAG: nicotinate phosphoribosyltransferase, partial [Candidatus Pacebacteria bacterium]|nr:nicotinate phosphoribosyltransferase [Candidatus Paceibacterota bacterium]
MIINSLLDNDLYKFTMMQIVLHKFSNVNVEYAFINRNNIPLGDCIDEIRDEIYSLESLRFQENELNFLANLSFIKPDFVEFLRKFSLNPRKCVKVEPDAHGNINIKIEGAWLNTILFEVPILAILSEVYTKHTMEKMSLCRKSLIASAIDMLEKKRQFLNGMEKMQDFKFAEFGTRRGFSNELH